MLNVGENRFFIFPFEFTQTLEKTIHLRVRNLSTKQEIREQNNKRFDFKICVYLDFY